MILGASSFRRCSYLLLQCKMRAVGALSSHASKDEAEPHSSPTQLDKLLMKGKKENDIDMLAAKVGAFPMPRAGRSHSDRQQSSSPQMVYST